MAILKRITDLDPASQPLGGTELAELSQGGVSKKVSLTNIFGANWWAPLRAAFSSFVAPNATHAIDSDTVGGETKAQLHDATKLTGAVPLANIPAQLTGKNAATATLAATATNALACSGNAATATRAYGIFIPLSPGIPVNSSSPGTKGDVIVSTDHLYICVNTNTWRRASLSSF